MTSLDDFDLEQQHSLYHNIVDHLESQLFLSQEEQLKLQSAKKKRLWVKDRIYQLGI